MMSDWEAFSALPRPERADCYSVSPGASHRRIAKSSEGHPALLLDFEHQASSVRRQLANLSYTPPAPIEFINSDGSLDVRSLAILECRSGDEDLIRYFFRVVDAVLLEQHAHVDEAHFERALDRLLLLFRALRRPPLRSIQGLWAELAVILWSSNPAVAISSWHSSPSALHDFERGDLKLEVKSAQSKLREHHFRLAQLAKIRSGETLVASVMLTESTSGASVSDLIEQIATRLAEHAESAARVATIVAETLGSEWRAVDESRFDLDDARKNLQLYEATQIPTIPQPLPPGVKDVHFVADLSGVPPVVLATARARAEFLRDLLPAE